MVDPRAKAQLEAGLAGRPAQLREICLGIQRLIRVELPSLEEKLNPWRVYSFVGQDFFAYLGVSSRHVSLGFLKGTSLVDPGRLLEGTGKSLRHVKFRTVEDLERPGLVELIAAAVELDRKSD